MNLNEKYGKYTLLYDSKILDGRELNRKLLFLINYINMIFEQEVSNLIKTLEKIKQEDLNQKTIKWEPSERFFKVVFFGDQQAGITTFLKTYANRKFANDKISNITGVDIFTKNLEINNEKYNLKLWQMKDQKRYKTLLLAYLDGVDIAVYMYDITDYLSLFYVDNWLSLIKKNISIQFPMIMVGCNSNLYHNRSISLAKAIAISKSRGFKEYLECSTLTGENINEIFEEIIKIIMQNRQKKEKVNSLLTSIL